MCGFRAAGRENEKPSLPKRLEGLRGFLNSSSSLAVFYVEQVALNRHVSPQPRPLPLCSKSKGMSRTKPEAWVSCRVADHTLSTSQNGVYQDLGLSARCPAKVPTPTSNKKHSLPKKEQLRAPSKVRCRASLRAKPFFVTQINPKNSMAAGCKWR